MKKCFLVIGLGKFGSSVVKELYKCNCDVVVCDVNEKNITLLDDYFHHHVLGDAKDKGVLDELNVAEYDAVIISIGQSSEDAILITKKLKDRGCQNIISKALDKEVGEILEAVGATQIIYPEEDAGTRLAKQIGYNGLIEYIELSENVSGVEMEVPSEFFGHSLSDLKFPIKFGLTVALLFRNKQPLLGHFAHEELNKGDYFLVVGENSKITKFVDKFCK